MSVNCQTLFKLYARIESHLAHQLPQFIFRRDQEPPLVSSVCHIGRQAKVSLCAMKMNSGEAAHRCKARAWLLPMSREHRR